MTAAALAPRPPLGRLSTVELRKMADTRAGLWLLVTIGVICAGIITIQLLVVDPPELTFKTFFEGTLLPVNALLPVLGILSVTSEWSQRTTLTTFALVPGRTRVVSAKLVAATVIAVMSIGLSLLTGAAGNLLGMAVADGAGDWNLSWAVLGGATLAQVIAVLVGVAFGMLMMNSALAIVLYYLLPTVWTVLAAMVTSVEKVSAWLNLAVTNEPLLAGVVTGEQWAKLGTSVALWMVLPLVLGVVRVLRSEVK